MTRLTIILAALLFGTASTIVIRGPLSDQVPAPTYLVKQGFEGTGFDNGETWISSLADDPDYTTDPIKGSQSWASTATNTQSIYTSFTPQTTVEAFGRLRFDIMAGVYEEVAQIVDTTGAVSLVGIYVEGTGGVKMFRNGGLSSASTQSITTATNYYVWMKFVSGGTCEIAISASDTRPTSDASGNVFLSDTGASGSAQYIVFQNVADKSIVVDNVLVSTSAIGNNPNP